MEKLTQLSLDLFAGGNFLLGFGALVLLGLFYWKRIYEPIKDYQDNKVKRVSEALECGSIETRTREFIGEELAKLHCGRAIGLGVSTKLRKAIIEKHKSTETQLGFYHFRSALPHLYLENSTLKVEISNSQRYEYWFYFVCGFVFLAVGLAFWGTCLLALYFPAYEMSIGKQFQVFFVGLGVLLIFAALSVAFLRLTNPYTSARKVHALIDQSPNDSGSASNDS